MEAKRKKTPYSAVDKLLFNYQSKDGDVVTNTRIPSKELGLPGGRFSILEKDYPKFLKAYNNVVFVKNKKQFLTEMQLEVGPIVVDLDFRYNPEIEEKQHSDSMLFDLICIYVENIFKLLDIEADFKCFVLEKDDVNTSNESMTKDGIHILFGINVDRAIQLMLRTAVLKEIDNVFEGLPLQNSYEDVLDRSVSRGDAPWQLYGSQKPGHQPYKIKSIYCISHSNKNIKKEPMMDSMELLLALSVRNKKNQTYVIKDEFKEEYNNFKEKSKKTRSGGRATNNPIRLTGDILDLNNIDNYDDLNEKMEAHIDGLSNEEYKIKSIFADLKLLTSEYYNSYDLWIKVGWALRDTSPKYFALWIWFSAKSEKFSFTDLQDHYDTWKNMKISTKDYKCLTYKTISYWAKQCNPEEHEKNYRNTLDYLIEMTAENNIGGNKAQGTTEYDIAKVIYFQWSHMFKCASISKKIWYRFVNHKWEITDSGHALRYKISDDLASIYIQKCQVILSAMDEISPDNEEKNNALRIKAAKLGEIARQLKQTRFKDSVMKECNELFYDKEFLDCLDKNPYLICFNNGVVDFKNKIFRDGRPDDYISTCTNIDYIPLDKIMKTEKLKLKLDQAILFLKQLFPVKEVFDYMCQHLASVLIGTNENQTFTLYVGTGRNGKSKLIELMEKILGEYKGTVPTSLVTQKRNSIGSTSPEVAQLQAARYAVMQEPSKGDVVNEGIMKELTGGDPIQARPLYRDSIIFTPQFTLVVCTNNLFEFRSNDDGTWRRIRIVKFVSEFVNESEIKPDRQYQFPIDKKISEKFDDWAPVLASYLVDIAYETQGLVKDCESVMKSSYEYREDQDTITQFCNERIIEEEGASIKQTELMQEFGQWYETIHGKRGRPKNKDIKAYIQKRYYKNERVPKWKGIRLLYNDELEEEE